MGGKFHFLSIIEGEGGGGYLQEREGLRHINPSFGLYFGEMSHENGYRPPELDHFG